MLFVVYMFTYQNHPAGPRCPTGPRGSPRGGLALLLCPQDTASSLPTPVPAPSAGWACTDMSPRSCFIVAPRIQAPSARQLRLEAVMWLPRAHHPPPRRPWLLCPDWMVCSAGTQQRPLRLRTSGGREGLLSTGLCVDDLPPGSSCCGPILQMRKLRLREPR